MPVTFFPHRFWAFLAIPVAMFAGDFLDWLSSLIRGREAVLSAAVGLLLGAVVVLAGLGEKMYSMPPAQLEGGRLIALVLAAVALFAVGFVAIFAFLRQETKPATLRVFSALAVLVVGVVVTSGYAKARFEGFAEWTPGVHFYITPEGTSPELQGYVDIRRAFPPNTRMFGPTCSENRIIGFDMWTPPLDLELRRFRNWLASLGPDEMNEELVGRIHAVASGGKFVLVTVDHYWAAVASRDAQLTARNLQQVLKDGGMSDRQVGARMHELLDLGAQPNDRERPLVQEFAARVGVLNATMVKIKRLTDAMAKSPLFRQIGATIGGGVTLFEVQSAAAPPETPAAP
jgi:hypothetical protein